jgi:Kef-type K+ transport system membrane component KefB
MLGVVRPIAARFLRRREAHDLSIEMLAAMLAFAFASAAATDSLGLHPLFGAFLAGICFPRVNSLRGEIRGRLETLVSVLLLPLFFAVTGMRTRLDLLNKPAMWLWAAVILFAATLGKIGGATVAARFMGQSWRDSLALGALLNTRGLVELIVLNIGYSVGVFSPTLFTMLVVMALVTTMCTTPILNLLGIEDNSSPKKQAGSEKLQPPALRS